MTDKMDELLLQEFGVHREKYEDYKLVDPGNYSQLQMAYKVRNVLRYYVDESVYDDDINEMYKGLLQKQQLYIDKYLERLGEFSNSVLIKNITYLAKSNGIKFGELEEAIGLSAGYISRTAKEDSKKKMSIDVVWKIAKLFETDIKALIETDLSVAGYSTEMLEKFVVKLQRQTAGRIIAWKRDSDLNAAINPRYTYDQIVKMRDDDYPLYRSAALDPIEEWVVNKDIYYVESFDGDMDLAIIPFGKKGDSYSEYYDFYLIGKNEINPQSEKIFSSRDDRDYDLNRFCDELYYTITDIEGEPVLSEKHRSMIARYIEEDN